MTTIKIAIVDGRRIRYSDSTYFKVQVGCGHKNRYETRWGTPNLDQAVSLYNGLNVGPGFKKRLVMRGGHSSSLIARKSETTW